MPVPCTWPVPHHQMDLLSPVELLYVTNCFYEGLVGMNHPLLLIVDLHVWALDCKVSTAIPESKLPKLLFRGTKMNETNPTPPKRRSNAKKHKAKTNSA